MPYFMVLYTFKWIVQCIQDLFQDNYSKHKLIPASTTPYHLTSSLILTTNYTNKIPPIVVGRACQQRRNMREDRSAHCAYIILHNQTLLIFF